MTSPGHPSLPSLQPALSLLILCSSKKFTFQIFHYKHSYRGVSDIPWGQWQMSLPLVAFSDLSTPILTTGQTGFLPLSLSHYIPTARLLVCTTHKNLSSIKGREQPWLAWLSWVDIIQQSERSLVRFPVRARAWVAGWSLCGVHLRGCW